MLPRVNDAARTDAKMSELMLGVKCGGSDGFSGLSANPSLGRAADLLVRSGGTVLITEVPEFCGAEHILAQRARDRKTGEDVYQMVDWYKEYASKFGTVLNENPSPGNVAGGLLNITIKSLGAIAKAGTTRVEGVTGYGELPHGHGLWLMQGPGYDQESTPGLVAAGAQVVVFTTGRGTTIGNAIAPVVKLSSNTPTFQRMSRDLDSQRGRRHRRHRVDRAKWARASSSTSGASPAARYRRLPSARSTASSGSGPNSRCRCDACGRPGRRRPPRDPRRAGDASRPG